MKIQNIFTGLLLTILYHSLQAVEIEINNWTNQPIRLTLIYKNNKKETAIAEPMNDRKEKHKIVHFQATDDNPLTEIIYSYINERKIWSAPIEYFHLAKIVKMSIHYPDHVSFVDYLKPGKWFSTSSTKATEVLEDI